MRQPASVIYCRVILHSNITPPSPSLFSTTTKHIIVLLCLHKKMFIVILLSKHLRGLCVDVTSVSQQNNHHNNNKSLIFHDIYLKLLCFACILLVVVVTDNDYRIISSCYSVLLYEIFDGGLSLWR